MPDGRFVPAVDAHVHLVPDRLVAAIRESLAEQAGWSFDHPTGPAAVPDAASEDLGGSVTSCSDFPNVPSRVRSRHGRRRARPDRRDERFR